jgi:ferredoxin
VSSRTQTVRIVVDGTKCDGHGICALILPELFSLDTWGYAAPESGPIDDPRILARALRAVNACPAGALTLAGDRDAGLAVPQRRASREER